MNIPGSSSLKIFKRYLIAVIGGFLVTLFLSWLFAIEIQPLARWQQFPDQWGLFEIVTQLFLVFCFFAAIMAILKAGREYEQQKNRPSGEDGHQTEEE